MSADIEFDLTVESFVELTKLVRSYRKHPKFWMFRGAREHPEHRLANRKKNLTPHLGRVRRRYLTSEHRERPFIKKEERELYEHFRRAAVPHIARELSPLELLAVARHNGLPTRLLDWTESLLIAAYFAVAEAKPGDVPVIYATRGITEVKDESRNLDALRGTVFYRPPHVSPRITAQRGAFSVHKNPREPFPTERVVTITLAGDNPISYKMDLHYAGINQATLFPDLEGVAQQLGWQYKWGALPPNKRGG